MEVTICVIHKNVIRKKGGNGKIYVTAWLLAK